MLAEADGARAAAGRARCGGPAVGRLRCWKRRPTAAASRVVLAELPGVEPNLMRQLIDQIRQKKPLSAVLLATRQGDDKVTLVAGVSKQLQERGVSAGQVDRPRGEGRGRRRRRPARPRPSGGEGAGEAARSARRGRARRSSKCLARRRTSSACRHGGIVAMRADRRLAVEHRDAVASTPRAAGLTQFGDRASAKFAQA